MKSNNNKQKSYILGPILPIFVVLMLLMLGPAQAVTVSITGLNNEINKVKFQVTIEIKSPDQYVPVQDVSVELSGPDSASRFFDVYGVPISGDSFISIDPVTVPKPKDYGYGYGYGYDGTTKYDFGMGNGYGKGDGKLVIKYNIEIDTKDLEPGTYTADANLNTGKGVLFSATPVTFTISKPRQGGVGVSVSPNLNNVAAGNSVNTNIVVKNTQNVDDDFRVFVYVNDLPPAFQANIGWFNWSEKVVTIDAGKTMNIPLSITVPAGTTKGTKAFRAGADSQTSNVYARATGYIKIS